MENRKLAVKFSANIIAFAVSAGIAFFITPYLVDSVGSEAYGIVPLALTMVNYVNIFTYSFHVMADRYISIELNSNHVDQANIYFNSALRANIAAALLLIAPSMLITAYLDNIFNVPAGVLFDARLTFGLVFVNTIIILAGNIFSVAAFSKDRLELTSYRSIEGNLLKLIATVLLFAIYLPKIYFIALSSIVSSLYTVFTNMYYTKKLLPEIKISIRQYSGAAMKKIMGSSLWNMVNQLSVALLTSLDLIIANILTGAVLSGQYALAKTVPAFLIAFAGSLVSIFVPRFTILYAQKKESELLKSINQAIKITGLTLVIPISFLIVFGKDFFALWVPGENAGMLFLLSNLTIIPMIISVSIEPIFNVYTVTDKLKVPALVLLAAGIMNTVIVIVLLKMTPLGIIAIPLASFATGLIRNLLFTPIYAAHCLNTSWRSFYGAIIRGVICSAVMVIISLIYKSLWNVCSWAELIIAAILCGGAAMVINIFFMFSRSELDELIKAMLSPKK